MDVSTQINTKSIYSNTFLVHIAGCLFYLVFGFCEIGNTQESKNIKLSKTIVNDYHQSIKPTELMNSLSDDTTITLIGSYLWSGVGSMVVSGNELIVRGGVGYQVFNISQPDSITLKGQTVLNLYGNLAFANEYAYILRGGDGISWIDYSDPDNIFEVGHFQQWGGSLMDFAFVGEYAILANGYYDGQIVDVSDPLNWIHVGYIGGGENVAIDSPYVYFSYGGGNRVDIFDISDINSPQQIATYTAHGDIKVKGDYCYIANPDTGLVILNISDPSNPQLASIYPHAYSIPWFKEVQLRGDTAFVLTAYYPNVIGIDVSNPYSPVFIGSFSGSNYGYDFDISDNIMFMGSGAAVSLDLSISPWEVLDTIGLNYNYNEISISDSIAAITCGVTGVILVNINNPQNPEIIGSFEAPYRYAIKTIIQDSLLYLATYSRLYILDVSDPTSPDSIAIFDNPPYCYDFSIKDGYLYMPTTGSGLIVIDIQNPANPQHISSVDTTGNGQYITIGSDHAFVSSSSLIFSVDINNPLNPTIVGSIETGAFVKSLANYNNNIYAVVGDSELVVIDVIDPTNMNIIHRIAFDTYIRSVDSHSDKIIVSAGADGIIVFDAVSLTRISSFDTPGSGSASAVMDSIIVVLDGSAVTILSAPFLIDGCCKGIRGNFNNDELDQIDISDLVGLVAYMFQGGEEPSCFEEADIDGSGGIDITDLVGLVGYMFQDGVQPVDCP